MKHVLQSLILASVTFSTVTLPSYGKISQSEADRLGNDLTPLGAEKAGNADGTIPAWEGGITE